MTTRRSFISGAAGGAAALALRGGLPAAAAGGPRIAFEDNFSRADRDGWGRAWFNQRTRRRWKIRNRKAIYRLPAVSDATDYRPNPVLVLDHDVDNLDLRVTVRASNATARVGVVARAVGYADYYAAYLGPAGAKIVRCGAHDEEILKRKKHFSLEAGVPYRIRLKLKGPGSATLALKIWRADQPEPAAWLMEAVDASADALTGRGAYGLFFAHARDGKPVTFSVDEFVARSTDNISTTVPAIAYSLAGPPDDKAGKIRLVAKTAVPARVRFEVAQDPSFSGEVRRLWAGKTSDRANTAKADLDLDLFGASTPVYWRAVALRGGREAFGDTSSFRTPPRPGFPVTFAFGSCTGWGQYPHTSFAHARLKLPDMYLHQGDFGYVMGRAITAAADTYQDHWVRLLMDPHLAALTREVPLGLYRDDAEYAAPSATRDTVKQFTVGAHNELHGNRPGPYSEFRYGDIVFFSLDCRRYSTGRIRPERDRSRLGAEQTQWLKKRMRAAAQEDIGLLVVASPQPFGAESEPASWRRTYTREWNDLMTFFKELAKPVLIVSGDAHGHRLFEYPQKNLDPDVPRIVEFLSSGTEQNRFFSELDNHFLLREAKGSGFGVVELGAEREVLGRKLRSLTLTATRSSDGTPFWSAQYTIVRGFGIIPAGAP